MLKSLQKIFLILAGSLAWSLTMVKSGLVYDYGVGFWGANGHDGVWHISLIRALSNGSFEMPIFAGEQIKNYHIGFDLLLAFVNRITNIPISLLYFQIFPLVTASLIGLLTYKFVLNWKKSETAAFWSTFFVYFGGDLGWFVYFLKNGHFGVVESMFWIQPSVLTLINPPYALSLVLILLGLNLMFLQKQKSSLFGFLFLTMFFGLLIQIKVYAGLVVLAALLLTAVYDLLINKKFNYLKVFLGSFIISFLVFLPNLKSGSLLVFKPFWILETMMIFPDRFGWVRFGEAMINYRLGGKFFKAVVAYIIAFLVFLLGNLGTRFLAVFYWTKILRRKKPESFDVFISTAIVIGLIVSLFFVQKGTPWNTIQFSYYSLFFVSIVAGIVFSGVLKISKTKLANYLLIFGMLLFTLPTTISVLAHFLSSRPPAMIQREELAALEFLSKMPKGVVLVMPFDKEAAENARDYPPRPLYLYESTSYVSAYSGQPVWLEDEVNLDIMGYNWQDRRFKLEEVVSSNDSQKLMDFLVKENISYIYLINKSKYASLFLGRNKIYENELVSIYY